MSKEVVHIVTTVFYTVNVSAKLVIISIAQIETDPLTQSLRDQMLTRTDSSYRVVEVKIPNAL
jgi:hypothetical protein